MRSQVGRWGNLAAAAILLLAIPLWIFLGSDRAHTSTSAVLALTVVMYSGARLVIVATDRSGGTPSKLMFWLFTYIFFGVCGLAQVLSQSFPWGGSYGEETVAPVYGLILAGMIAFDLGGRTSRARWEPNVSSGWKLKPGRIVVLVAPVLLLTAYSIVRMGGVDALFQTRVELEESLTSSLSTPEAIFFRHMANTPVFVLFVLSLLQLRSMRDGGHRVWWLILTLCLGGITVVVNNPISTPRFQVGWVIISTFFAFGWSRKKALAFSVGLAMSMLVVFPLADAYRAQRDVDLLALVEEGSASVGELASNGDYDAFQQTLNAFDVVSSTGLRLGQQIGGALLFWVPRSIWSSKPVPTGEMVAEATGYAYLNLSAPLWAEFYVDGGVALVAVGMFGFGWFVSRSDAAYGLGGTNSLAKVLSVLLAGYQFFLLRGSLMSAVAYFIPGLIVVLIATCPNLRLVREKDHVQ